jgi:hypothetical protein
MRACHGVLKLDVCTHLPVHLAVGKAVVRILARAMMKRARSLPVCLRAAKAQIALWAGNQASGIVGCGALRSLHPNELVRARAAVQSTACQSRSLIRAGTTYQTMHRGSHPTRLRSGIVACLRNVSVLAKSTQRRIPLQRTLAETEDIGAIRLSLVV